MNELLKRLDGHLLLVTMVVNYVCSIVSDFLNCFSLQLPNIVLLVQLVLGSLSIYVLLPKIKTTNQWLLEFFKKNDTDV